MNPPCLYRIIGATLFGLSAAVLAHDKEQRAVTPPQGTSAPAAVVDAFAAALVKGDEAAAKALLAPDVLIYESGGQESSREEYASHHLKEDIAFLAGSKHETLARTEGGDDKQAWVSTRSRITGRHKDKDMEILSTESMMLKNTSEGWRIVHIHWPSQPAGKR